MAIKPDMVGIYGILNKKTLKWYVGSSVNLDIRKRKHFNELRRGRHHNIHLQRAWNEYGEATFAFIILEGTKDLIFREKYWISKLRSLDRNYGYNLQQIDNQGRPAPTPEVRQRIARSLKGRVTTDETKAKLSSTKKGKSPRPYKWTQEGKLRRRKAAPLCPYCNKPRASTIRNGKHTYQRICGSQNCFKAAKERTRQSSIKVTAEILKEMTKLRADGYSISQIASSLNLGRTTIKRYLRQEQNYGH